MKLTPNKAPAGNASAVWAEMYKIPSYLVSISFPCEIAMEIQGAGLFSRKPFVYVEEFDSQIVAVIYMQAIRELICRRKMSIFSLQLDPIFDIAYDGDRATFSRSDFRFSDSISNISRDLQRCVDEILLLTKTSDERLKDTMAFGVERLKQDFVDIDYAAR